MSKPTIYLAKALLVAAAFVFATAGPALAQRHGGRGGGVRGGAVHGGVVHGGVAHGGVVRGGFVQRGGFGDGGFRRGGFRGGWGGGGWGGGGWGWGFPWYGYGGWGYYPYGYSYYPGDYGYYGPDYYTPQPYYQDAPLAPGVGSYSFYPPPVAAADNNTAIIEVRVPPETELWFDGMKTTQQGSMRYFTTPPLVPGKTFTYELKASWMVNGAPVTQTRQVTVEAGKRAVVDFLGGAPQAKV
jgi:uncharacterized protein (TIGR03000 family)